MVFTKCAWITWKYMLTKIKGNVAQITSKYSDVIGMKLWTEEKRMLKMHKWNEISRKKSDITKQSKENKHKWTYEYLNVTQ